MLSEFTGWVEHFEAEAERRRQRPDPQWTDGADLTAAVVRSVQRFQVGEAGDGANLIAKAEAAGDEAYAKAVRMFVDEERNHARLLENLLRAANAKIIGGHWTDAVFVRLRRALGLRLELMVLMIAEVVALRYYRVLRDGTSDPLTTEVAGRILADEERHVPFHLRRLAAAFAPLPPVVRLLVHGVWRVLLFGAVVTVSYDHGPALRQFGLTRRGFVADVLRIWSRTAEIHDPVGLPDRAVG
ncbi:ferritin-like domain-containing protein [Amycolatopsis lurida]